MYQQGLLETKEENEKKYQEQILNLPVSPLQEKQLDAEPTLTEREFQILEMTLKGVSISEIAMKIFLSIAGVKWRLGHIYEKFGAKDRLKFINKAATSGIQFRTQSGIRHNFHCNLEMRAHEDDSTTEENK